MNIILNYVQRTFRSELSIHFNRSALLYGKMNQNLPTRAYWYNVSDATDICAEYTFRYTLTGDYITGMTIEEKINPVNGATAENNTYEYEFIYNFVVEQK